MNGGSHTRGWGRTFLLLLLVVGTGAAALAGWRRAYRLDRSLTQAQAEISQLRTTLTQAQVEVRTVKALQAEIERLQRETQEIHRLRAQLQECQQVQSDLEKLQQQNANLQQSQQALTRSLQEATRATPRPEPTAWVGIAMDTSYQGAVKVLSVAPGSPAAAADIEAEDLITAVDGQQVTTSTDLRDAIAAKKVGQNVILSVQRGGQVRNVVLRTAAFPR